MKRNRAILEHEAQLERAEKVFDWIELVKTCIADAPTQLGNIIGISLSKIITEPCFMAVDDKDKCYIHQKGEELYLSVTGEPYPVFNTQLWPWTHKFGNFHVWGIPGVIISIAKHLSPRDKISFAESCKKCYWIISTNTNLWEFDVKMWPGIINERPYRYFCRLKTFVDNDIAFKQCSREMFNTYILTCGQMVENIIQVFLY